MESENASQSFWMGILNTSRARVLDVGALTSSQRLVCWSTRPFPPTAPEEPFPGRESLYAKERERGRETVARATIRSQHLGHRIFMAERKRRSRAVAIGDIEFPPANENKTPGRAKTWGAARQAPLAGGEGGRRGGGQRTRSPSKANRGPSWPK